MNLPPCLLEMSIIKIPPCASYTMPAVTVFYTSKSTNSWKPSAQVEKATCIMQLTNLKTMWKKFGIFVYMPVFCWFFSLLVCYSNSQSTT